jgi:hypothetical protein
MAARWLQSHPNLRNNRGCDESAIIARQVWLEKHKRRIMAQSQFERFGSAEKVPVNLIDENSFLFN